MKATAIMYEFLTHQVHLVQIEVPRKPRQDEIDAAIAERLPVFHAQHPNVTTDIALTGVLFIQGTDIVWLEPSPDRRNMERVL